MTVTVNTRRLQRKFADLLQNVKDPKTYLLVGGFIIQTIRERTRRKGRGVKRPGGRESKLKRVSEKWANRRVQFQRHPEAATGRASNLTFKGNLLNSLIVKRASSKGILIGFRRIQDEQKAEGQLSQGRAFMNLSRREIVATTDFLKQEILRGVDR